ncbi:MAG: CBS domain-containing protein [Anaerolineales bacterium]|nr:CBS domain-containing protein [Anaerolineales bacterium]
MLTMLVVILHELDYLPELLDAWRSINVPGVTILQTMGGFQAEAFVNRGGLGSLLGVFENNKSQQRTLFSLIDDPELLEQAIAEADRVVKGFDRPHSGILFTIPLGQALGLQKWGKPDEKKAQELLEEQTTNNDKGNENLVKWLEEGIKEKKGKQALSEGNAMRKTPVSEIIKILDQDAVIVPADAPLNAVVRALVARPDLPFACVVNNEKRLVGLVNPAAVAEQMMVNVMPDEYVDDPLEYEKARKLIDAGEDRMVSDVMGEPVFVHMEDKLDKAYHEMRTHGLSGVPVVDKHYHVQGFVSLVAVMAVCTAEEEK